MAKAQFPSFSTFGEMLRYLRRRAHLTQMELSIATGYSESQISRLEQNERLPDAATLLARFVPALGLEDQPDVVDRLMTLATAARAPAPTSAPPVPSLAAAVSPTRSDDAPRTNLPPRLTSFVGREQAVTTLRRRVAAERSVTLTGVGGVGKSSLSQAVGGDLTDEFADGVWLVELAALADPELLAQRVAATFRLPEASDRPPTEVLTTYLQRKHLLLILDNCEHLIDACAQLVDLLRHACPNLHILATSRESLRVAGEVEWPVPPLDAPRPEHAIDAALDVARDADRALRDYSALRLFVERARAVQPEFEWSDHTAAQVARICAQLDGIPLAIELAAARLKGLSVSELAARLDDRFRLLAAGARSAPARHQTLRAAIDWSYNLLSEPERILLRRLSVFAGGWALDAVEAIAGDLTQQAAARADPVDLLLQLVNKSLVVAEARGASTRYRLLETIRQYAAEKLRETCEAEATHARHFALFLRLAEQWTDVTLVGPRFTAWLDRLVSEMDNLRAAYAWSQEQQDAGLRALQLAGALWLFWYHRGRWREGQLWLGESLARSWGGAPPQLRATALVGLANLARFTATATHTTALAEEALRICRQVDDRRGMAQSYFILAQAAADLSDYARSDAFFAQARDLFRSVKWLQGVSHTLFWWAVAILRSGRPAQAIPHFDECLAIGMEIEDLFSIHGGLGRLLQIDMQRGKALYRQELARRRTQADPEALAALLQAYGRRLVYSPDPHDLKESIQALEECLSLWQKLGIQWSPAGGTARAHFDLGTAGVIAGEYPWAVAHAQEAIRLYGEVGDVHGVAWAQTTLGWAALCLGSFDPAAGNLRAALELSPDGSMNFTPHALAGMAELARLQGDLARAGRLYGAAAHFELQHEPLGYLPAYKAVPAYLGDPVFAAAWAEGQAMTVVQAVAYALE